MCRLLFRALKPLKSSLHFFQVAFFRDEVQPESCVRAFRTHTTTQATLATLMQATLAFAQGVGNAHRQAAAVVGIARGMAQRVGFGRQVAVVACFRRP